jgi:putative transcriptional regulator
LINIDGLDEGQALSLRAISYFLSAYPLVISMKTNRGFLSDDIIYSRFNLQVITPDTFRSILEEELIPKMAAKGRHTISIDSSALREKRKEMQLSLGELSKLVGISKKALYEIESRRVNPTDETVKKLEAVLKVELKNPFELKAAEKTYLKPKEEFQGRVSRELSRIGIDNSSVYSAPFEIIGRERFSIITSLSKNSVKIRRNVNTLKRLSSLFSSKAVFVAKRCEEKAVEGIPIILESELLEIESSKELGKILEEKV